MPPDPNARRDKTLEAILGELRKTNGLLQTQNKVLEKMERYGRPAKITQHSYLERSDGGTQSGAGDQEGATGSNGSVQGGDSPSSGSSLGSGR